MMSLKRSFSLLVIATATLSIGVSACSGGGDDDDDGNTPLPNPFPQCEVLWASGNVDAVVVAATEAIVTGSIDLATTELAFWQIAFYNEPDGPDTGDAPDLSAFANATDGSLTFTAPSNSIGQEISLDTPATSAFMTVTTAAGGAPNASFTAAAGTFTGLVTELEDCIAGGAGSEDCPVGVGAITGTVTSGGSTINYTAGEGAANTDFSLAYCYDPDDFFAALSPMQRAMLIKASRR